MKINKRNVNKISRVVQIFTRLCEIIFKKFDLDDVKLRITRFNITQFNIQIFVVQKYVISVKQLSISRSKTEVVTRNLNRFYAIRLSVSFA